MQGLAPRTAKERSSGEDCFEAISTADDPAFFLNARLPLHDLSKYYTLYAIGFCSEVHQLLLNHYSPRNFRTLERTSYEIETYYTLPNYPDIHSRFGQEPGNLPRPGASIFHQVS